MLVERASVEQRKVGVNGGLVLFPVIADRVGGVERDVVVLARRLVGGKGTIWGSLNLIVAPKEKG